MREHIHYDFLEDTTTATTWTRTTTGKFSSCQYNIWRGKIFSSKYD
jgi:hypothetical protein